MRKLFSFWLFFERFALISLRRTLSSSQLFVLHSSKNISKIKKVLFFGFCLSFWRDLIFYKLNLLTNTANLVQICRKFGLNLIKFYDFAMQINLINKFKLNSANLRF